MKVRVFSVLCFLVFQLVFESCSRRNDKLLEETLDYSENDYYQFKSLNLEVYDLPISLMLPDETAGIGNVTQPVILHEEGSHLWSVQVGRSFIIEIEDMGELNQFLPELRSLIRKNEAFDYKLIHDKDGIIVYSRQLSSKYKQDSDESFFIMGHLQVEGRNYLLKNQDLGNSKKEILFMQKSLESIKIKSPYEG